MRVCQAPHVVGDWKFLGRNLDLSESQLSDVEGSFSTLRDRCFQMLVLWRETKRDDATPAALIRTLRKSRYNTVAGAQTLFPKILTSLNPFPVYFRSSGERNERSVVMT